MIDLNLFDNVGFPDCGGVKKCVDSSREVSRKCFSEPQYRSVTVGAKYQDTLERET